LEHKQSMYADDMKVCVTTENSIYELFKLFEKYESATNSKINKDKTEALWLGNWIGRTDTPLGLNWTSGEIKHLGVYVGNNRDIASQRTFEEIIIKIKNKITYWNTKFISKKGKARILNIYGLTKLWYALEIHDISNSLLAEITDICKSFIWNGHHQRSLSVLCRPYSNGGLALQSLSAKTQTLRIRWLECLVTQKHLECERNVVELLVSDTGIPNIVGLDILRYKKNFENCIGNKYYKNAYKIWLKMDIFFLPTSFESIKNDWIYHNLLLTDDDGRVFKPPGMYTNGYPAYSPTRFDDLPVRVPIGDLRGVYRALIPKINNAYYNIVFSHEDEDSFQITKLNEEKMYKINDFFKDVYSSILSKSDSTVNIWENKWASELGNGEEIVWDQVWDCVHNNITNYKVQSSIWEMIHRNYICAYILTQMYRGDGICKLCKNIERTRTHVFMNCEVIESLYQQFGYILSQLGPTTVSENEKAFGLYNEQDDSKSRLRNYVTYTIRHIVFRNRNIDFALDAHVVTIMANKIKAYIRRDLKERYYLYKYKNKLNIFKDIYLLENIIGNINNGELFVYV